MTDKPDTHRGSKKLADVLVLPGSTSYTPVQALDSAKKFNFSDVMIIGYEDGDLIIRSSRLSRAEALWMLECAKIHAMDTGD